MRSLDAHGSVQKKKMKLLEIAAGNENKKTNSSYFLLSSWASSLKGF